MILPVIEAERIKRRISKEEFADSIGVTKRTVNNWQNGTTEIPLSKLLKISDMFGVSCDYLLGRTDDQGA